MIRLSKVFNRDGELGWQIASSDDSIRRPSASR